MKRLLLITGMLMSTGMTAAQAGRCSPYEEKLGCHTALGDVNPGASEHAFYCKCSDDNDYANEESDRSVIQPEEIDVILNLDGQRYPIRCCGGGFLPRECPCQH